MKSKGQILIGFVLLIPILFVSIVLVFEILESVSIRKRMESVVQEAIYDGLKTDYRDAYEKVYNLIDINIKYDDLDINVNNEKIEVKVIKNTKYKIIKRVKIQYIGYYEDLKIEKE